MTDLTWLDDALCMQIGGDTWFPSKGGSPAAAKRTCRTCPVRAQCLDWAVTTGEPNGVWGGMSPRERRAHTRQEQPA